MILSIDFVHILDAFQGRESFSISFNSTNFRFMCKDMCRLSRCCLGSGPAALCLSRVQQILPLALRGRLKRVRHLANNCHMLLAALGPAHPPPVVLGKTLSVSTDYSVCHSCLCVFWLAGEALLSWKRTTVSFASPFSLFASPSSSVYYRHTSVPVLSLQMKMSPSYLPA